MKEKILLNIEAETESVKKIILNFFTELDGIFHENHR